MSPDPSDTRDAYEVICEMRREADFDVGWARAFFDRNDGTLLANQNKRIHHVKENKTEFPDPEKENPVTRTTFIKRRKLKGGDKRYRCMRRATRCYTDMYPGRVVTPSGEV